MSNEELCYLPATEMMRRFRARDLSPVEVMQAVIERAEAVEPRVNALTHRFFDEALESARAAEKRYMNGGRIRKLEGLPVAIKDETLVKGMPCTSGALSKRDFISDYTSIENSRILRAGGIIHARTATPEFSCAGYTHSKLWGVTRNPWNLQFTPGGSSGGAAAALASGVCALASGSDIAGSIRIPASACGLVGFKPPYGRNASEPPFNLDTYCHTGPLARNVADVILFQNVVSGPHPRDVASIKPRLNLPSEFAPVKGWKIAWSMDLGSYEIDPDVRANTLKALDVFRDLGAVVDEVEIRWPDNFMRAARDHLDQVFGVYISEYEREHGDSMTDYARAVAREARNPRADGFYNSLCVAGEMYERFGPLFNKYNLFICPTNAVAAVAAEHDQSRDEVRINGRVVDPFLGWFLTLPFNMMSRCPVLTAPSGRDRNNVPTGIQMVGATYRDKDVLRAASAYEAAMGEGYTRAETRPPIQ